MTTKAKYTYTKNNADYLLNAFLEWHVLVHYTRTCRFSIAKIFLWELYDTALKIAIA